MKKAFFFLLGLILMLSAVGVQSGFAKGGPDWDKSSISVGGSCEGGTAVFVITNSGDGDMSGPSTYELIKDTKDGDVVGGGSFQLNSGESVVIEVTEPFKVFIKVYQRPGHPGTGVAWADAGPCGEETETPTATPTDEVTPTVTPTDEVTPTVTPTDEVTPTPTDEVTPTPTEVTETPGVTPTPTQPREPKWTCREVNDMLLTHPLNDPQYEQYWKNHDTALNFWNNHCKPRPVRTGAGGASLFTMSLFVLGALIAAFGLFGQKKVTE